MNIQSDTKLDFDDVLLAPQRSTLTSRKEVDLERTFKFYHSTQTWTGIPVMCANMSFASFDLARALAKHRMITCLPKYLSEEDLIEFFQSDDPILGLYPYAWVSVGFKREEQAKLLNISKNVRGHINICIDVPNGQMDCFVKYCAEIRSLFPNSIIMAGNVTDPSSTRELIIHGGIDIVKVGIGPGSACTTRFLTGCGVPQFSACIDNAYAAHGLKRKDKHLGLICADGGCRYVGDISKAFGAGSDFCMLGGMFAGTDECVGDWITESDGGAKESFIYYGMSTHHSQEVNGEGKKEYRASEGTKIKVPYKGSTDTVVQEILGGLRSACSYIGATSTKDMSKCASFVKVSRVHSNQNSSVVFGV